MRRKWLPLSVIHRLVISAIGQGGFTRHTAFHAEWDLAPRCERPTSVELYARPDLDDSLGWLTVKRNMPEHPFWLLLHVKCRKCETCMRDRAYHWRRRAESETGIAPRTWFGTLTATPDVHHMAVSRARQRFYARAAGDFDALAVPEQFRLLCNELSPALTKYIKRLRKETAAPFKYLLVTEAHTGKRGVGRNLGNPHFHMLLHERSILSPVRHATLVAQWRLGFSKWKLISEPQQVTYVCKYMANQASRIRASQRYGNP